MFVVSKYIAMQTFPILHTQRLDLIEIRQEHLGDIFKLFGDENVTRYYNLLPFQTEQDGQKLVDWFRTRFQEGQGIRWGIALKGSEHIIGTLGFNNFTRQHRANLGYDLQTAYWNNGYITEALRAVITYGFHTLEVNRIEAEVMQGNIASEKVLEKLGFRNEGLLCDWMLWNGRHYDMTMFSLLRRDINKGVS